MKLAISAILAACVAATACTAAKYEVIDTDFLWNEQGHAIGHKERLRNSLTGEEVEQVKMYVARRDPGGAIVGYEERVTAGTLLRDLDGRPIGVRYQDLRSRGTNPQQQGPTVIIRP